MLFHFRNFSQCVFLGIKRSTKLQNSVHSKGRYFSVFYKYLSKNYNKRLIWTTALISGVCDITKQPIRISLK